MDLWDFNTSIGNTHESLTRSYHMLEGARRWLEMGVPAAAILEWLHWQARACDAVKEARGAKPLGGGEARDGAILLTEQLEACKRQLSEAHEGRANVLEELRRKNADPPASLNGCATCMAEIEALRQTIGARDARIAQLEAEAVRLHARSEAGTADAIIGRKVQETVREHGLIQMDFSGAWVLTSGAEETFKALGLFRPVRNERHAKLESEEVHHG